MAEQDLLSRRQLIKIGTGLSAMALMPRADVAVGEPAAGGKHFPTGYAALDGALGGGLRAGTLTVVIGPQGSGKTAFLQSLAQANGVAWREAMCKGTCDMLSIMQRDGKAVGHLMCNSEEPWTDRERTAIGKNAAAHHLFLLRWFARTREVLRDSGGIFVFSILGTCEAIPRPEPEWTGIPDYIIALSGGEWSAVKMGSRA